jgi:hypothetical protein
MLLLIFDLEWRSPRGRHDARTTRLREWIAIGGRPFSYRSANCAGRREPLAEAVSASGARHRVELPGLSDMREG